MKRIAAFILFCVTTPSMGMLNTPQDPLVALNDEYRGYTTTEGKLYFLQTKLKKTTKTMPIYSEDYRNSEDCRNSAAIINFVSDKSELEYKELKKEAKKNLIPPRGYSLRHYNTALGTMAVGTLCGLGWGYLNKKLFGDSAIKHGILGFFGSAIPLLPHKARRHRLGYELATIASGISSLVCLSFININATHYFPYSKKEKRDAVKKEFGTPKMDDQIADIFYTYIIKVNPYLYRRLSIGKFFRSLASLGMGIVASVVSIVHTEECEHYQALCEDNNNKMDKFSKLIKKCSHIAFSLKTDFIKAETREKKDNKLKNLFDITIKTVN